MHTNLAPLTFALEQEVTVVKLDLITYCPSGKDVCQITAAILIFFCLGQKHSLTVSLSVV